MWPLARRVANLVFHSKNQNLVCGCQEKCVYIDTCVNTHIQRDYISIGFINTADNITSE